METTKASSKKIMVNYGLLLGVLGILINVVLYATNNHLSPHWSIALIGFGINVAIMVIALKAFRTENGGFMTLTDALKVGLGVALIAAILGAIYTYLLMTVIEPTYMEQVLAVRQEAMIEQNPNMTDAQIEQALEISSMFSGKGIIVAMQIIGGLFFGFIISLIAGLILKRENPYADA